MLKIRTTRNDSNQLTVHLSGQLTGEYVPELEKAFDVDAATQVSLDMSNVTFVDRESMEFLCGARSRVNIQNVPSYVMRWIEQEFRCAPVHPFRCGRSHPKS